MLCGWEGNRRSGVALAMHHTDNSGITTFGLMALGREMSTPPKLQQEYGTLPFCNSGTLLAAVALAF